MGRVRRLHDVVRADQTDKRLVLAPSSSLMDVRSGPTLHVFEHLPRRKLGRRGAASNVERLLVVMP